MCDRVGAGQGRGPFGRQGNVAEDDADAPAVEMVRHAGCECLQSRVQGQMKDRIEWASNSVGRSSAEGSRGISSRK